MEWSRASQFSIWSGGSTYLAIRFAIETMPPLMMGGTRFLIAGLLLYLWVHVRGAPKPRLIHWRGAFIVGGLLLLGGHGSIVLAEQVVPSGLTALLVATVPLWMVLLDWARPNGTRPGWVVFLGVAVGLGGIALLLRPGELAGGEPIHLIGALAIVFASLCWAGGSLYSRSASLPKSPLQATALEMVAGGALLVAVSLVIGEGGDLNVGAISLQSFLSYGYLIVIGSLVAFPTYIWLLRVSTPARVATYAYVNPVVAVFLGWALASEPLTPRTIAAAAVIIAAVVLITRYQTPAGRE